jgi:PAS domain S-box-containing protein
MTNPLKNKMLEDLDILIVDDEKSNIVSLNNILVKAGYKVRTAENGQFALKSIKAKLPDLVLLDIRMPGMDGFEVCRKLKEQERSRDIPVIFICEMDDNDSKLMGFRMGAVDYISKPFNSDEALARVLTHTTLRQMQLELESQNKTLANEIVNRKQAEKAIKVSETKYSELVKNSPDAIAIYTDETLVFVNYECVKLLNAKNAEELLGRNIIDFVHPDYIPIVKERLEKANSGQVLELIEEKFIQLDGSVIEVEVKEVPTIFDDKISVQLIFRDITDRNKTLNILNQNAQILSKLLYSSIELVDSTDEINYSKITDQIAEISHAKYAAFNVFDENGLDFTTAAFSGLKDIQSKSKSLLGHKLINKKWKHDAYRAEKIKNKTITHFQSLNELSKSALSKSIIKIISKTFRLGDVFIVKISKHNVSIGDFTLLFEKGNTLQNPESVELYANQIGLFIERERAKVKLIESKELLTSFIKYSPVQTYIKEVDSAQSKILSASDSFFDMIGIKGNEMIGKTMEELFPSELAKKITEDDWNVISKNKIFRQDEDLNDRNYTTIKYPITIGGKKILAGYIVDITEQKQIQKALNEKNQTFTALLENLQIGVFMVENPGGKPIVANEAAKQLLGRGILPAASRTNLSEVYQAFKLDTNEHYPVDEMPIVRGMQGEKSHIDDMIVVRPDGTRTLLEIFGSPVRNSNNEVIASIATFVDITARKQIEQEIKENESRFRAIFDANSAAIAIFDTEANICMVNEEYTKVSGYSKEELVGMKWTQQILAEDLPLLIEYNRKRIINPADAPEKYEFRFIRKDGEIRNCLISISILQSTRQIIASFLDITERKQAEDKIREKDIEFRKLSANLPDLIFQFTRRLDGSYCVPIASEGIMNIFGCKPEDVIDTFEPINKVIHPEDVQRVVDDIENSAKNLTFFSCEFRVILPKKGVQWIYSRSIPEKLPDGSITWYGFNANITEHKKIEEKVASVGKYYQALIEKAPDGFVLLDANIQFSYLSSSARRIFGYDLMEVINLDPTELTHPEDFEMVLSDLRKCIEDSTYVPVIEYRYRHKKGHYIWIESTFSNLYADPDIQALLINFKDITDKKKIQTLLTESELFFRQSQQAAFIGSYNLNLAENHWNSSEVLDLIFGIDKNYDRSISGWADIVYEEDKEMMVKYFAEEVLGKKLSFNKEYRIQCKSTDEIKWVHGLGQLILDENNNVISMVGTIQDITDRKLTQEILIESERRFREMLSTVTMISVVLDLDGDITFCNDYFLNLTKTNKEDIIGSNWFNNFVPENVRESSLKTFYQTVETGQYTSNYENTILDKDGNELLISWNITILYDISGKINGIASLGVDITEQRKAENSIRRSKDRLNRAELASKSGNWELNIKTGKLKCSKGAAVLYGLNKKNFEYDEIKFLPLPQYRAMMDEALNNLIENDEPYDIDFKIKTADTNEIKDIHSSAVYDRDKETIFGVIQDITEKKQMDEALRTSEEEFRQLFENAPVGVYRTTPDGQIMKVNPYIVNMLRFSSHDEIMKRQLSDNEYEPGYSRKNFIEILEKEGEIIGLESKWKKRDGTSVFVRESAKLIRDEFNNPLYYEGTIEDITQQKLAEQKIRESEETFRLMFENNPQPMFIYDLDTLDFIDINRAAINHYGYTRNEFISMNIKDIRPQEELDQLYKNVKSIKEGSTANIKAYHLKKNGELIAVEIVVARVVIKKQNAIHALINDVTERNKTQNELHKKIDEMERFHRVTINRELTMIELKKEINELLDKSGQQPKYKIVN